MTVQNAVAGTRNPERRGGGGQVYNELPSYHYTGTVTVSNVDNNSTWESVVRNELLFFYLERSGGNETAV